MSGRTNSLKRASAVEKARKRRMIANRESSSTTKILDATRDADEAATAPYIGTGASVNQLDYELPETQTDIEGMWYEERLTSSVCPIRAPNSVEFFIESTGESAVVTSLYDSYFRFTTQITHQDGTKLAHDEKVSVINFLLNTQFKRVCVHLNGQPITASTSQSHHYWSYVSALCNLSDSVKDYLLSSAMWKLDTESDSNTIDSWEQLGTESNFRKRASYFSESNECILTGRILDEALITPLFFPPNSDFKISLQLNNSRFIIIADPATAQYTYSITDARMFVAKYRLRPHALARQTKLLSNGGLNYLFPRCETRMINIPVTEQSITAEINRGRTPDRVYVMVSSQEAAVDEKLKLNPLHFSWRELETCQLILNGTLYPSMPYSIGYSEDRDETSAEQAFYLLNRELNLINSSHSIDVSNYATALYIMCFDLSRDHSAGLRSSYLSNNVDGTLVIKGKFRKPIKQPLVLICLLEFVACLRLTNDRKISVVI